MAAAFSFASPPGCGPRTVAPQGLAFGSGGTPSTDAWALLEHFTPLASAVLPVSDFRTISSQPHLHRGVAEWARDVPGLQPIDSFDTCVTPPGGGSPGSFGEWVGGLGPPDPIPG